MDGPGLPACWPSLKPRFRIVAAEMIEGGRGYLGHSSRLVIEADELTNWNGTTRTFLDSVPLAKEKMLAA